MEEWFIRENAHEPIVTSEEYEQAQESIRRRRKSNRVAHDQSDRVYYCAHCGGKLEKRNGSIFACSSHRYHEGSPCGDVHWKKSALEEVILEALKRQIEIVRLEAIKARKSSQSKIDSLHRQLSMLKAQYDACGREKFTMYEEYREGKLSAEDYLSSKDKLTKKQAALKEQLEECEAKCESIHRQQEAVNEQQEVIGQMTGLSDNQLRLHLYDAVDRVLVYDAETIEIVWMFDDIALDNDVHA